MCFLGLCANITLARLKATKKTLLFVYLQAQNAFFIFVYSTFSTLRALTVYGIALRLYI